MLYSYTDAFSLINRTLYVDPRETSTFIRILKLIIVNSSSFRMDQSSFFEKKNKYYIGLHKNGVRS